MAQVKNYGLIGVGNDVQLGKQGPRLLANADTGTISVTNEGGSLTTISGANASQSSELVTKAQLDTKSVTFFKANMTAVYADSDIRTGDCLVVTNADDGEYAVYIAKQDAPTSTGHLTLISTRDGAGSDAATLSADVTFSSGNVTLGNVSSGGRPLSVVIDVTSAFDGNTEITIGDDNDPDRLMTTAYVDLSEQTTFVTNPSYVYVNALDADNTLKVYVTAGNSTVGNATILVSYS